MYTYVCIIKAPTFFSPPPENSLSTHDHSRLLHTKQFFFRYPSSPPPLLPSSSFVRIEFLSENSVHHQEMYVFGKVRKKEYFIPILVSEKVERDWVSRFFFFFLRNWFLLLLWKFSFFIFSIFRFLILLYKFSYIFLLVIEESFVSRQSKILYKFSYIS